MAGKLIFVSGLTGAGKTTLVGQALESVKNLEPLRTYVTRPPRSDEVNSHEYIFVSDEDYESIKHTSKLWDETIVHGVKYGADAEAYNSRIREGKNIIVSVAPSVEVIAAMSHLYNIKPLTLWIDTPEDKAKARVRGDPIRSARIEDEGIKNHFDVLFAPTNDLEKDSNSFIQLIRNIIEQ